MPLSVEERRLIEDLTAKHAVERTQCTHCMQPAPCTTLRLLAIIERVTPTIFAVGERVQAINYKGERLGRGRVTASQRENGFYMKVKLDGGVEVVVPQATCKRLVKKP